MASMFGKDAAMMDRDREVRTTQPMYNSEPFPPKYGQQDQQRYVVEKRQVEVIYDYDEPVECTPAMCAHPMGLLRWFHLIMYFILQWLVQVTCGRDACTMIMNVFGYIAMGQLFVLLILLLLSIICSLLLIGYAINAHRAYRGAMLAVEKLYALLGIALMLIAGILGTWMAVLTNNPEVNYQGRGYGHIKGQWIAAAVLEFLMAGLFIFDFILQRKENFPFSIGNFRSEAVETTVKANSYASGHAPRPLSKVELAYNPGEEERRAVTTHHQAYYPEDENML